MCRKQFLVRKRGAGYRRATNVTQAASECVGSPQSERSAL